MLVDGFMCGDYVGRCELTAESVELLEDMLSYGMHGYLEFWFVGGCGYVRVVIGLTGLECGIVCLFAV